MPAYDLEDLRPHLQAMVPQPGLMAFIEKIDLSIRVLADLDACRRIAVECIRDVHAEGIDYVEVRFSPRYMADPHDLSPEGVVEAIVDGVAAEARSVGVKANLIGIMSRTYGPDACWEELRALETHADRITAIDIAGDEAAWPGELFVDHFRRARELGWKVTAHAGEAAGPESIWAAIHDLGATRIGHALHAIDDRALMDYMADNQIGVEISLTSNVQISAVPDYASHPIASYVAHGMRVTLNTDDPAISRITLPHEYNVAAPAAGLTPDQIRQIQHNGLAAGFLTDRERATLLASQDRSTDPGRLPPDPA
jgi:adenosine deaminase